MPKPDCEWWSFAESAIRNRMSVDAAIERLKADFPEIDIYRYCKMVYLRRTNSQEGAAAYFGISRRKANAINYKFHAYVAEEMGFSVAKK